MKNSASSFISGSLFVYVLLFLVIPTSDISAQGQQRLFYDVSHIKVKPGAYADYVKLETEVWKKIHAARVKAGKMVGWYLLVVVFPSGTQNEYDFVTINVYKDWGSIGHAWEGLPDLITKTLTKEEMALYDKTESLRDIVRSEIWVSEAEIFRESIDSKPYTFQHVGFRNVEPESGKWEAYMSMEKEISQPLQQKYIKDGKLAGWGLYNLYMPWNATQLGTVATCDFYDKWEDIYAADFWADVKKMHPQIKEPELTKRVTQTSKFYRSELRQLVSHVNQASVK